MIRDKSLNEDIANKVYDILVAEAGAYNSEHERQYFVFAQTKKPEEYNEQGGCTEFRFGGKLGFGGKFWNTNRFYVTTYSECEGTIEEKIITKVNELLKPIYEEHLKSKK